MYAFKTNIVKRKYQFIFQSLFVSIKIRNTIITCICNIIIAKKNVIYDDSIIQKILNVFIE